MPMEELAYKNRFVRELVQTIDNYSEASCEVSTPQIVSGEDNLIILRVSLDEWIKLLSSVFTGADICYPEESDSVRWSLLRAVECPVDLCALIAQCIATSEATQEAIRNFVTADEALNEWAGQNSAYPIVTAQDLATNFGDVTDCNPDYLFNVITVLVDIADELSKDIFEIIEVATNSLERANLLVSGFPALGLLPFDELIGLGDQLAEEVQEEYLSEFTETLRDEIRCGLFCLFKDDCEMEINDVIAWYEEQLGASLPQNIPDALQAIAEYILFGSLPGPTAVYAMHLLVLAGIRIAQNIAGVSFTTLGLRLTAAADEGDNDWEVLCTDCPEPPEQCFDFILDDGDWVPFSAGSAIYTTGLGWHQTGGGGVIMNSPLSIPANVTNVRVRFSRSWAGAASPADYDRFFIEVNSSTGTAGTICVGCSGLQEGIQVIVNAPPGTFWSGAITVNVQAGGFTWPSIPPNNAAPQYITEICLNV